MRTVHFLAKQLPGRRDSGGRQRVGAFIDAYLANSCNVIVYSTDLSPIRGLPPHVPLHSAGSSKVSAALRSWHTPMLVGKWGSQALVRAVESSLRPEDIIHCDFPQSAVNVPKSATWANVVVDFHNLEHELALDRLKNGKLLRRRLLSSEVRRLARYEEQLARRVGTVVACSELDYEWLSTRAKDVVLAENGVSNLPQAWTPPPRAENVLFIGSMDYEPNEQGARWLVNECWPRVLQLRSSATLCIAGRKADRLSSLVAQQAQVSLIDTPDEVGPLYESADLCVVPLLTGGGTKIKLLEAIAYGRKIVTTSVGAAGLHNLSRFATIADSAEDFAQAIVRGLQFQPSSFAEEQDAFEFAADHFSWQHRVAPVVAHILAR